MQLSWIDADAIREVAAKLQDPAPPRAPVALAPSEFAPLLPDVDSGEFEEEFAPLPTETQLSRIREQLRDIRLRAEQAGLLPVEVPLAPAAPPAVEPEPVVSIPPTDKKTNPVIDAMTARLDAFAHEARRATTSADVLLLDGHGDLLWSSTMKPAPVIAAALSLTETLRASQQAAASPPAVIRGRMGEGDELTLLPCLTRHGLVILVLVKSQSLTYEIVSHLRSALTKAVES